MFSVGMKELNMNKLQTSFLQICSFKYLSMVIGMLCSFALILCPSVSHSLPQGGVVADGQATISTPNPNYMQIDQHSNAAVINWQSFNIGSQEHTHFQQPSINSIAINRVNAANGSSAIFGKLTSTGQIFLLNPAGVIFGPTAQVNVGSILASTSDLNFDAYKQGRIELIPNHNYNGQIINQGSITVRDGGYAMFAAPNINNQGIINAKLGHVQLSSGDYFTVDLYGDGLINLKIPEDQLNPSLKEYKITHSGKIYADGGIITMTAANADSIVSSIINMEGLMQADSISNNKGKIILTASDNGYINFSADSRTYAASGYVKASAGNIKLASGSVIDASSKDTHSNAGEIYIGGNYQGKLLSDSDFNAKNVIVEPNAHLLANAKTNGNGGKIVVWSDDTTSVAGNFEAKSGSESGNGGLIETSGKLVLDIKPEISINTKSMNSSGKNGEWLLDPVTLTIDANLANSISQALINNNVTLSTKDANTTGNIASDEGDPLNGGTGVPSGNIGEIIFGNNANIIWGTFNKFTAIADTNIVFGGGTITSLANGDIALVTGATTVATPTSATSCIGLGCGNITGYTPTSIMSLGGGNVELYITNQIFGTPISNATLYPNLVTAKTDGNIIGQVIMYDYIYNSALGRTINNINTSQLATFGPIQQSFALHEDIVPGSSFNGLGSITAPYTSHFDGMGHKISGFNIDNTGNAGFFNVTNSNVIETFFPGSHQYIKNIDIDPIINVTPASPGAPANAGVLIGQAIISAGAPLDISDVSIFGTTEVYANIDGDGNPIFGNAGTLIGQTIGPDGSTLNLRNITINDAIVSSSHSAGGIIGDARNNIINLSGAIFIAPQSITALLPSPINTNADTVGDTAANVFAGGLIGKTSNTALILNTMDHIDSGFTIIPPTIRITDAASGSSSITAETNLTEGAAFAGGLIGGFDGSSVNINPGTLINVDIPNIDALVDVTATQTFTPSIPLSAAYAGGLFGAMNNPGLLLNINSIDTSITSSINASTNIANSNSYVGGLIGDFLGAELNLNTLAPGSINIFSNTLSANVMPFIVTPATPDISNMAFAGGLIGNVSPSGLALGIDALINSDIVIDTQPVAAISMNASQDGRFISFAGGIFGKAEFDNLSFNSPLFVNSLPVSKITAAASTRGSEAFSGGISGQDDNVTVNYNSSITTDGAMATVNQSAPANSRDVAAYAGGIAGFNNNNTTIFNNGTSTVTIEDISGNGEILADAQGANAASFAGGLYGITYGDPSASNLTINSPITINVAINANTGGGALNIANISNKYTDGGIFAGGLLGFNNGVNTTINNTVSILDNTLALSATSTNAPTGEAEQAVGGIAGGFVNASFSYNTSTFSFINERNNSTTSGNNAGVFGLLDVNELSPTVAAGVTNGSVTSDELNDSVDWDSTLNDVTTDNLTPSIFTYNTADPCAGPSAGLCSSVYTPPPPPPPPPTPQEEAEEIVTHTNTTQSTAHGGGHDGHAESHQSHLPHPPHTHRHHHDHEGHHQYVTEEHGQEEYKNETIVLGDPVYSFTIDKDLGIKLFPFTYRARHGFLFTTQDRFGDFIRENTGHE